MGKVYFGVPNELALKLRDAFGLSTFIETGTYKAATSSWAAEHFEQVYTIEGWKDYYDRASRSHQHLVNVKFLFGDSRQRLPEVLAELDKPALIWLDAHYLGDSMVSAGTPGECPVMDELEAINAREVRHFILIDDLHCFQGELNKGSWRSLWPTLDQIKAKILEGFPDYLIITYEDVIIAVPPEARGAIEDYMTYPGIQVVVPTSNKYVRVLNGFSHFLNKFWSDKLPVTVVRYDVRPPKQPPNFRNVAVGNQADYTWCSGLRAYLDLPQAPRLFVLMLEDYYLSSFVDKAKMAALWQFMCAHDEVVKIDLSGDRMKFKHESYQTIGGLELIKSADTAEYRGSIQAAIWRGDYLREQLNPTWDAWQFEKHGCNDGALILGAPTSVLPYINAIGGAGRDPGKYDHKKIPAWMWQELKGNNLV